jgi:5-deoxy-glucuronate isomerase
MKLHFQSNTRLGYQKVIDESFAAVKYTGLDVLRLTNGESYSGNSNDYEMVLVLIKGQANITVDHTAWKRIGNRNHVFEGPATAVYVPIQAEFTIAESEGKYLEIVVCRVKANKKYDPFVITPKNVEVHYRGSDTWKRVVHDIIPNDDSRTQRIAIGETFSSSGSWASYPPHKKEPMDAATLQEEELHFFQVDREDGFGLQLMYTDDQQSNHAFMIRHGDAVILYSGNHPVCAAGGYRIYYLWFTGGPIN